MSGRHAGRGDRERIGRGTGTPAAGRRQSRERSGAEVEADTNIERDTIDVLSVNGFLYLDGTVAIVGEVLSTVPSRREGVNVEVNSTTAWTSSGPSVARSS